MSRLFRCTRGFTLTLARAYSNGSAKGTSSKHLWLLTIPVTTFCLGTWQIFRLQWKINLIDELDEKTRQPPIPIPQDITNRLEELEYRRVTLSGHYDHNREMLMWPRVRLDDGQVVSSSRSPESGAFVITPFFCNETMSDVLVNRGWVPKGKMDPRTRPNGQIEGEINLTAVVRTQDNRSLFGPKNDPDNNYWVWRDIEGMSKRANTSPIFVDADATSTVPGGPIGGQTKVTLRNEHLQYIFTWYALSLATSYMFWQFWKKAKRVK